MTRRAIVRRSAGWHEPDWWLLSIMLTLVMFGTVMIFSASFPDTAASSGLSQYSGLLRQLAYAGVGLLGMVVAMRIDYHRYRHVSVLLMGVTLLVLAAMVVVPGLATEVYGARSWIFVGPVSIQPSEVAKLVLILYLASWLSGKGERLHHISTGLAQFVIIIGALTLLLMLQPDLGTASLIATIGVAMFFVAGAEIRQFVLFIGAGASAFLLLALSAEYRRERLLVFLNPDADLQNLGWQLWQARLALGSGGLFGVGLGASRQKFTWLPMAHNDAIFAVIGEELGLIGCGFVLLLFVALAWRGYTIAMRAPDRFGGLIAVGVTTWIVFQAVFNIGGITLAVPFTGIPLPFISAGGSSLAVALTAAGVLLNVSRQTIPAGAHAQSLEQETAAFAAVRPHPGYYDQPLRGYEDRVAGWGRAPVESEQGWDG